ncbi:MAG: ABC transporter ATP-binding protein [Eubacteriaceae bacterium]|nr:ABC transporter ATP-binding protein [Eubacteriaceae bacterium]
MFVKDGIRNEKDALTPTGNRRSFDALHYEVTLHGVNGSGKTMLLRMIAGLITPTAGRVYYNDKILHEDISFPKDVGIVIEHMEMLPGYSGYENLLLLSKIKKIAGSEDILLALKRVGLSGVENIKVKKYSLGMKQRLNIAQAIFEKQKIILLDEPTNALDEEGVEQIYDVISDEKKRGATIVIATHHKTDLERMCDVTLKMENGYLIEC